MLSKRVEELSEFDKAELTEQKLKLEEIYKQKAEGAFIRSRRKWLEEGEKSSAYFFRLERQQAKNNHIEKLRIKDNIVEDPKIIANFCSEFYSNLYASNFCQQSTSEFFESLHNTKQISNEEFKICEAPLSLQEITDAINSKAFVKCSKAFNKLLSPFLFEVFKESIESALLPPTLCQGLITLISKPNKDPLLIDSWRPITLLNNDYKIIALVLSKRLKCVLNNLIDECQSGFLQKRHICNNIRLVLDILDYSDFFSNDNLILFLDYYKAFDSLEHEFLLQTLRKVGFGDFFCRSIKMLYTNCNSSIKLSSGTSPRFALNRGVRQGCPISPYLFLIATELLHLHIRESPLKGITVDDTEVVITQLADDTVLFLKDASQVAVALKTLEPFSKVSGLRLNINKCELLPVGNCLESLICNIPVRESVTYLGIKIIKDDKIRCPSNFLPISEKTRKVLNHWLQRDLSLKGRVLLTKAEGISRLSYAAQTISVDKHTSKLIEGMLTKFLWKNKIHYIKKSVTLNSYDKGGLNCIDFSSINSNFKIIWIRQYLQNSSSIWNIIPRFIFSHLGGLEFLLMCNYKI